MAPQKRVGVNVDGAHVLLILMKRGHEAVFKGFKRGSKISVTNFVVESMTYLEVISQATEVIIRGDRESILVQKTTVADLIRSLSTTKLDS